MGKVLEPGVHCDFVLTFFADWILVFFLFFFLVINYMFRAKVSLEL